MKHVLSSRIRQNESRDFSNHFIRETEYYLLRRILEQQKTGEWQTPDTPSLKLNCTCLIEFQEVSH